MSRLPHKKGYKTAGEAMRSKAFTSAPGTTLDRKCPCGLVHVIVPTPESPGLVRSRGLGPVSAKRQAQNRQRRAMAAALWTDRPLCAVPWCGEWADDLHEPLPRARGGSITDPENAEPLCRRHHDMVTFLPESQLQWAYELGLLRHSWQGDAA